MTLSSPALLEIAANSVASALAAQAGGAHRIELCSALELGGLTPSHAQIAMARERLRIQLHVLIRPRAGDFVYGEEEHETMRRDIEACAALGCDGVVLGALDVDGNVDLVRCRELAVAAKGMSITFHRAIDVSRDPLQALADVIELGCTRVLSSGARPSALDGTSLLREMVLRAGDRIVVMPGAGIDAGNVARLRELTGAREFHASAKRRHPSTMRYAADPGLGMSAGEIRTDIEAVRQLVAALQAG